MLHLLQGATENAPLILPDSLQKANLAKVVDKISHIDYHQLLTDVTKEAGWIVLKIALALVIYFIGKQLIKWIIRIMDKAFNRHKVEASLRSFLRSLVKALLMAGKKPSSKRTSTTGPITCATLPLAVFDM